MQKDFQNEIDEIKLNLLAKFGLTKLVGHDPRLCEALAMVRQIAVYDIPVLLCGETGTGKELFARAIHYLSPRASKPFMPVNCAAIPAELFENELFGHVKGAFTGAIKRKEGIIQAAAQGTVFLDEIDSISPSVQAKLLRFLEEKEYKPLGLNRLSKAEVRIVAAARGDLRKKVQEGSFRDDLFYRLNVVSLFLPPLRERKGDIPLLAEHFLRKYAAQLAKAVGGFGPGVLDKLACYNWPGNIRELENAVYHAVAVCQGPIIYWRDLDLPPINASHPEKQPLTFKEAKANAIENFERQYIAKLLIEHAGNVSQAARAAHKHRRAFWELMKKYKINAQNTSVAGLEGRI
jgi:transcriptional regulator with PAS, ATPase and Fis domain